MQKINFSKWINGTNNEPHVIFRGDNIEILKKLHSKFDNSVSCIYIDPPYNNGEKYAFYDDDTSHDKWLAQMKAILLELKPFLQSDGSIWISIDDGEMHYLKVLCDSVFGRKSFVTTVVWQQRNTRENRKAFSNNHEYILVYSPDPEGFKKKRNLLPVTDEVLGRYSNPDNDPRGPWQSVTANVQDGHAVSSQFYEIVAPNGKVHNPPPGRCWIYNKERMLNEIKCGNIWFGKDGNGVPRVKKFVSDRTKGIVPETLWLSSFVGTNKDAKTHLRKLKIYDKKLFDTPKPETLIGQIIGNFPLSGEVYQDEIIRVNRIWIIRRKQ